MDNAEYWRKRFEKLEASSNSIGRKYYENLEIEYDKAIARLNREIEIWYTRLASNNDVSLARARELLKGKELKEFLWTVEEYIKYGEKNAITQEWLKELENASAKAHIDRYSAIKVQMQHELEVLTKSFEEGLTNTLATIYEDNFYHTAYEIDKGTSINVGSTLKRLDVNRIDTAIKRPWAVDGRTFDWRIWKNKEKLMNTMDRNLTQSIMRGDDPQKAIDAVSKAMNVSKRNAGRLIMTESSFAYSASQIECYKKLGVDEFEIVATLDSHTSEICRGLDGKHFPINEYKIGQTAPPFHVNCRTCTCPYFDDFTEGEERAYRDADGKTQYVKDMTYDEWHKKYVQDSISVETSSDYEKYSSVLGENTPSIEEFQKIRYNKDTYKTFRTYTSSIKSGELSPLADFSLYQSVVKEMDDKLVGIKTKTGVKITGKSNHSIARVIGSVEQKRNGVQVSDILDSLTSLDSEVLPMKEMRNGKSQKFRNKVVEVSINPDTGNIIQVNPVHTRKKVTS